MKIIAVVAGLILCAGTFFQAQASCITTESVKASKNSVRLVKEDGKKSHYEMRDQATGEWFEAEVVGKDSHNLPIFDFTEDGETAKENHDSQGGGGGGGGPH